MNTNGVYYCDCHTCKTYKATIMEKCVFCNYFYHPQCRFNHRKVCGLMGRAKEAYSVAYLEVEAREKALKRARKELEAAKRQLIQADRSTRLAHAVKNGRGGSN